MKEEEKNPRDFNETANFNVVEETFMKRTASKQMILLVLKRTLDCTREEIQKLFEKYPHFEFVSTETVRNTFALLQVEGVGIEQIRKCPWVLSLPSGKFYVNLIMFIQCGIWLFETNVKRLIVSFQSKPIHNLSYYY